MASIGKVSPAAATFAAPASQASQSISARILAKIPFNCASCRSLTTRNIAILVTTAVAAFILYRLYGSACASRAEAKVKAASAAQLTEAKTIASTEVNAHGENAPTAIAVATNLEKIVAALKSPLVAAKIGADSKTLEEAGILIAALNQDNANLADHVEGVNSVLQQAKEILDQA